MAVRARRCQASALLVLRPSGDGNCDHLEVRLDGFSFQGSLDRKLTPNNS